MRKVLISLAAVAVVVGGVAAMSAFEAHVINVTAKIENALSVSPKEILFGTVFPQEVLYEDIDISLSDSFMDEERVDDVNYVIKQKPKPIDPEDEIYNAEWCHEHLPSVPYAPGNLEWMNYLAHCYYPLCSYLSKTPDETEGGNDTGLPAFHSLEAKAFGRLAKSEEDTKDIWTIDLDVPCFEGMCAQDWTHQGWELPADLESETFGCDLWVEVTGISQALRLENKNPSTWEIINDEMYGILAYNVSGLTFDYHFTAHGLQNSTEYSLIYYADKPDRYVNWGGDNPGALIGTGTTDGSGELTMSGNPDLGMDLPNSPDANMDINNHDYCGAPDNYVHCTGAKIWLVPSADYAAPGLTAWNPSNYLFETDLITYDDTDIP